MKALNKQALREAAEKATQGPWVETCGEVTTADYEVEGVTFLDHICNCEIIGTESPNAEFIAAANPATVLALLDELEAAEKRIAEQREYYEGVIADGSRRIAELEARTVTLPPKEHDNGTDSQIDINAGFANRMWQKCADAIRAAGIGVKGE
ncbi:TPA: ead/Ea22-like family protein [Citrobacter freundii]|nr:ead/Ea22-like family protein [Salmonella enterica]EKY1514770.1 ead/Ea22-like family protein [Citrobacter freundii]EJN8755576.1 ead/Ea22-like family protein [Salmonella enterica]HAT2194844.1 ead/Ea22-like family protein [Citrobacter freundii]HAT2563100.1 ead/Ea22-like family protein [Citrobacter freundii]